MQPSLKTLSLFPGEPKPPHRSSASGYEQTHAAVWIAIHAPHSLGAGEQADSIHDGLRSLAIWARTLTPTISFVPPDSLLLEVQASLRLFGGLASIESALSTQAEKRLATHHVASAPTANAALWLSRHENCRSSDQHRVKSRLRALPIEVTGWPEPILHRLAEMGVKRIGDVLRLPRDGLARRIGITYLRELDKAMGSRFDVRPLLELPDSLSVSAEIVPETVDRGLILETVSELLDRMTRSLRHRQRQILELELRLSHLRVQSSVERFELLEPTHDRHRLECLLALRMERARLRAPVAAVELETGGLVHLQTAHTDLFPGSQQGRDEVSDAMIERLRERFGPKNVYGIATVADHRPESAWIKADPGREQPALRSMLAEGRPLWLLPVPRPLRIEQGCLIYRGALKIQTGPERIESGWWDLRDVSRDYYSATGESGESLWIYRDNVTRQWYLHGVFG